ncbi:glycosyltransferase family 2 protein [Candidatus Parcubacteria bacterium]|nr:glycosyltransferase family 2 protein [Patescibacteria group bacterium]MCG2693877.1 glycosyltransferase family 2 protein [Candidatus Parcubacteria bacterium]
MTLSIIYINYNTRQLLKQSLKHLFLISPAIDFEVIVVDNNSSDGSSEMLLEKFPQVKVIRSEKNLGYAGGANLGLKNASGSVVAVFNADIFITQNSLETAVNYMDNHIDIAMVGPKLINADGSLQYSCYQFPRPYIPILRRTFLGETKWGKRKVDKYLMKDYSHEDARQVDWLLGGALIARKSALFEVGFFDERYFLYFEDTDLAHRLKDKNYKLIYLPSAKMYHLHRRESADTGLLKSLFNPATRAHIKSAIKYFWKWR